MNKFFIDDKQITEEYREEIRRKKRYTLIFVWFFGILDLIAFISMLASVTNIRSITFMLGGLLGGAFAFLFIFTLLCYKWLVNYEKNINFDNINDSNIKKNRKNK